MLKDWSNIGLLLDVGGNITNRDKQGRAVTTIMEEMFGWPKSGVSGRQQNERILTVKTNAIYFLYILMLKIYISYVEIMKAANSILFFVAQGLRVYKKKTIVIKGRGVSKFTCGVLCTILVAS